MNRYQWQKVASCIVLMLWVVISASLSAKDVESKILIFDLKGIILCNNQDVLSLSQENVDSGGVIYQHLNIPGDIDALRVQLTAFLNRDVTQEMLQELKQTIVNHYATASYPFVAVNVPPQEVTAGSIRLIVSESRLGAVSVEGNRWVSDRLLMQYVDIQSGDLIHQRQLIQNVSFINRHPFRRVDLVFAPGKETDTTNLILATKDRSPLRIYSGVDNTGVEPTGEWRWYAGFNWGNAFGLDHILSYQFTSSFNMNLFQAHTMEYLAPLSWGHIFKIYGGYSEVHPHVAGNLKRNDGWSMQSSMRYVVPLKIHPYLEHEITSGGDFKRSNNTFEFTEDVPRFGRCVNLTQLVLGYSGNYERNHFRLDFDGEIFWSPGEWLADQTDQAYGSLRPEAVNHWVYFYGSLAYLQRLPQSFSIFFLAEGQVASQPLLPSEQFGLGGYNTVRGYEEREINKDDGILLSLEARSPGLPITKWIKPSSKVSDALQFLAFIDYGWGVNIDTIPGTNKADYLLGAGPGLRYTLESYLTIRLDWGIRLHNKTAFEGSSNMIHFSLTGSY